MAKWVPAKEQPKARTRLPENDRPLLIVFGSRDFADCKLVFEKLDFFAGSLEDPIVVHGDAPGADRLGEDWACKHKYLIVRFRADWDRHGKKAGPIRNQEIVDFATAIKGRRAYAVGFWDGKSPGTRDMLERLKKAKIPTRIVRY